MGSSAMMFHIFILASLALVFHHVAATMMLEAHAPLDDAPDPVTVPTVTELAPSPPVKCDVRKFIYLDITVDGTPVVTNLISGQKFVLPKGNFELNFNADFTSFYVGGISEHDDADYIKHESDMWACFKMIFLYLSLYVYIYTYIYINI